MIEIQKEVEYARYSRNLESIVNRLSGVEILRKEYESTYQGFVDVDVLLSDGRVFSYCYSYGSCSGCDEWEGKNLSDDEIESVMMQESTIFNNRESYNQWRENVKAKA